VNLGLWILVDLVFILDVRGSDSWFWDFEKRILEILPGFGRHIRKTTGPPTQVDKFDIIASSRLGSQVFHLGPQSLEPWLAQEPAVGSRHWPFFIVALAARHGKKYAVKTSSKSDSSRMF